MPTLYIYRTITHVWWFSHYVKPPCLIYFWWGCPASCYCRACFGVTHFGAPMGPDEHGFLSIHKGTDAQLMLRDLGILDISQMLNWLVGSNMKTWCSISFLWDVIIPIDEVIFHIFQDGHIAPPTSWICGFSWIQHHPAMISPFLIHVCRVSTTPHEAQPKQSPWE